MDRRSPLALGAAGGSVASVVLKAIADNVHWGPVPPFNPLIDCICPQLESGIGLSGVAYLRGSGSGEAIGCPGHSASNCCVGKAQ